MWGPIGELERIAGTNRRVGENCGDQYYSWRELQGSIGDLGRNVVTNRRVGDNCGDPLYPYESLVNVSFVFSPRWIHICSSHIGPRNTHLL